MKVKYIGETQPFMVTNGKTYEVLSIEKKGTELLMTQEKITYILRKNLL